MKLIFAIVHDEDSPRLMVELNKSGYRVTKLNSSGGFLRSGNTTLMMVVEDDKLKDCLDIVRKYSSSRKAAINTTITPSAISGYTIPIRWRSQSAERRYSWLMLNTSEKM